MGSTSYPDPWTTPFKSGMPRLVLQSAILSRGTLTQSRLLLTVPMGSTSSPDPSTAPFESGMQKLVLQSAILLRGTLSGCNLLLPLPMGGILSPDPETAPFEPGMLRLILQLAILSGNIITRSSLLHTPLDGKHIVSGFYDNTTCVLDPFPYAYIRPSSCNPTHPNFCAKPDKDGWVKDSEGGLLYWVPHECRISVHSPAVMTIPLTSCKGTVSLDFDDFAFGTSWSQIFKSAPF